MDLPSTKMGVQNFRAQNIWEFTYYGFHHGKGGFTQQKMGELSAALPSKGGKGPETRLDEQ
jgi:hypothetical protein